LGSWQLIFYSKRVENKNRVRDSCGADVKKFLGLDVGNYLTAAVNMCAPKSLGVSSSI